MAHPEQAPAHGASTDLRERAREIASDNGFVSDFPPDARAEVARIEAVKRTESPPDDVRDLRAMLWSSIDNRESRDLDQVEFCEPAGDGGVRLRLGIADVDQFVPKGSAIDRRAAANTTSVYTGVATFPMLPEELSTGLTSFLDAAASSCRLA